MISLASAAVSAARFLPSHSWSVRPAKSIFSRLSSERLLWDRLPRDDLLVDLGAPTKTQVIERRDPVFRLQAVRCYRLCAFRTRYAGSKIGNQALKRSGRLFALGYGRI